MPNARSNNQSEGASDSRLDPRQEWATKNLWPLIATFLVSFVLCFVPWFVTVLVFPANDMQQGRDEVVLKDGRTITAQYPQRFLADERARPIYLTTGSLDPITITIKFDKNLPLVLTSVVASSTVTLANNAAGDLIIVWPASAPSSTNSTVTSSSQPSTSVPVTAVAAIPIIPLPNTASLYFKNAGTESGWFPGFSEASLEIAESAQGHKIRIEIETTNRASWRAFAEKYSFIAILPFLVPLLVFLVNAYAIRRSAQQRQMATERLEAFKTALSNADKDRTSAEWDSLKVFFSHLSDDDRDRADRLMRFSQGEILSDLVPDDFNTWTDSWAGALILAGESLLRKDAEPEVGRNTKQAETDQAKPNRLNPDLYRYIRIFPFDRLPAESENPLRKFQADLDSRNPQTHDWPRPADPPLDYPTDQPTTIAKLRLFPVQADDAFKEIGYLFSEKRWYWIEHPLYEELTAYTGPQLVCGEPGSGRTALALALTRYDDYTLRPPKEGVLGSYHDRPVTLLEAQQALVQELLIFIRWRSTWLTKLEREDRNLLASLLLSVFDGRIVLTKLGKPEPTQFDWPVSKNGQTSSDQGGNNQPIPVASSSQNSNNEDDKKEPNPVDQNSRNSNNEDDKNRPVWEAQAKVGFSLLRESVEGMTGKPRLAEAQWFYALSRCAQKMGFTRVRIALDMTYQQYEQWRSDHLGRFLSAMTIDSDIPVQLIMLAPGATVDFDAQQYGIVLRQLRWDDESTGGKTPLNQMLEHRFKQRTGSKLDITEFIPEAVQCELCDAAQHNPRRLATLWQRITREHPDEQSVKTEMFKAAAEVK